MKNPTTDNHIGTTARALLNDCKGLRYIIAEISCPMLNCPEHLRGKTPHYTPSSYILKLKDFKQALRYFCFLFFQVF